MKTPAPPLLPIFRSGHQLKLLAELYVNSGRRKSLGELARETGIPQPTLSREVDRLAKAGLVRSSCMGRMRLVEAAEDSPYFPELRALLLKAMGPSPVLRRLLGPVRGVREAHIFGSWARRYAGEFGPPPRDLDVVVVGEPDVDELLAALRLAESEIGLEVNQVTVTPAGWRRPTGFLRKVKQGPLVPLLGERRGR